jgi:hypothetical protein
MRSDSRLTKSHVLLYEPVIDLLLWRAQAEGTLRADFHGGDIPVLQLMITAAFELTRAGEPESWRRRLELLLDGLRARRDQPSPLTRPVLDDDALERAMGVWPANRRGRADEGSGRVGSGRVRSRKTALLGNEREVRPDRLTMLDW